MPHARATGTSANRATDRVASPATITREMTPRPAFTVGYEGSDLPALLGVLTAAGVTTVVDTRRTPTSRRPAFRREALRRALEDAGLSYVSRPALGMPKALRPLAKRPDRRWLFDLAYRGVLARAVDEVDETVRLGESGRIALLCFEIDPGTCHRELLARAMAARGPFLFDHLRPGDREDADDHPVTELVVRPHD